MPLRMNRVRRGGLKVHPNGTKKQYTPVSVKSNGRRVSIHSVIPVEKDYIPACTRPWLILSDRCEQGGIVGLRDAEKQQAARPSPVHTKLMYTLGCPNGPPPNFRIEIRAYTSENRPNRP